MATIKFTQPVNDSDMTINEQINYLGHQPVRNIFDINMPHINGFEVMQAMQKYEKDSFLPVLVISGNMGPETKTRALELGAIDF